MNIKLSSIKNRYDLLASDYSRHSVVMQEIASRLLERLQLMKFAPKTILDLGAGTGFCAEQLRQLYPDARIISVDISHAMLLQCNKDIRDYSSVAAISHLPLKNHSIDCVISNMALPHCEHLSVWFNELTRVMVKQGVFLFSSLGPDTFKELALLNTPPVYQDMHDIGDALLAAKFKDPVMDMEYLQTEYDQVEILKHDLFSTGLLESSRLATDIPNPLSLSWEIIYGHALGPGEIKEHGMDDEGMVRIPIQQLRSNKK